MQAQLTRPTPGIIRDNLRFALVAEAHIISSSECKYDTKQLCHTI
ncbi:unnamed protein product [Chondrus crispus]|uniref:Uncharacterized protein n=1 Tax=Chondrus crispus TaxID=2769 RepID=R7QS82_CHOCR|nr:unnamed protein product [Chondrus crispus]CDF40245.1 unnamed protein product [Chondrus crispus]|eukprot:XP_005710539.1 unnamed protein product [Chondrus crispus]